MPEGLNKTTENEDLGTPIEKELSLDERVKKLEVENKELKDKLENREKLFRIISHDLKGPVSNTAIFIKLLSEYIKDGSISNEELINNLDTILQNSENTSKLLEDLLTWSKLQQDEIKPEILVMNLTNQVENSIALLLQKAKEKNINFENKVSGNIEILADRVMLETVIRNLSSNAIKFTNSGGNISISYEKKNNLVEIYIKDDGIGLKDEQKKNLFESIGVSTNGTGKETGTGLGISICKEMVEKMGGNIKVESEGEGKGTTFIVTLPTEEGGKEKVA